MDSIQGNSCQLAFVAVLKIPWSQLAEHLFVLDSSFNFQVDFRF